MCTELQVVSINGSCLWFYAYKEYMKVTLQDVQLKADMKSDIPLERTAIFFLASLFLKQGITSKYVMVDFN